MAGPQPFSLVLAMWGTRYGVAYVNSLAAAAYQHSPRLHSVVLLSDRPLDGLDPRVDRKPFPPPYDGAEFFGHGYRAKLAVFSAIPPAPGRPVVYLDLDSIIVGDLACIADLVTAPTDLFMLPPAGLGFGRLRRLLDRLRGDDSFPVGNSSVLAFRSDATPNLGHEYAQRRAAGDLTGGWQNVIDDVLISWFGRGHIRPVPIGAAVMMRREFMSRLPGWPLVKAALPRVRRRRAGLAAVTMNGLSLKPEVLATLPEGAVVSDGRGRYGRWGVLGFGTLWQPLAEACRALAGHPPSPKSD